MKKNIRINDILKNIDLFYNNNNLYYKMIVNFFMIRPPVNIKYSNKDIYNKFNENIPQYSTIYNNDYEGTLYLFCIDDNIDFRKICNENNFMYLRSEKKYIDNELYNNKHKVIYKNNSYTLIKNE